MKRLATKIPKTVAFWVAVLGLVVLGVTLDIVLSAATSHNGPGITDSFETILKVVVAGIVFLVTAFFIWAYTLSTQPWTMDITPVGPNLYQSGNINENDTFESLGVNYIVDLSHQPQYIPSVPIGCRYTNWPIVDRDIPNEWDLQFMVQTIAAWSMRHPVLIKCDLGVNRSGLLVAEVLKAQRELIDAGIQKQSDRIFNPKFVEYIQKSLPSVHP